MFWIGFFISVALILLKLFLYIPGKSYHLQDLDEELLDLERKRCKYIRFIITVGRLRVVDVKTYHKLYSYQYEILRTEYMNLTRDI